MDYVICKDIKQYVKQDLTQKIQYTTNITLATRFTYHKADRFLKNNISPKIKNKYKIIEIDEGNYIEPKNQSTIFQNHNYNWLEKCTDFQQLLSQIEIYENQLNSEFDKIEKERVDVEHRFEAPKLNGSEFNAAELCNLGKKYREVRRKRRVIKNEKRKVGIIKTASLDDFKNGSVIKQIQNIDNQKYTPRVLTELFEI